MIFKMACRNLVRNKRIDIIIGIIITIGLLGVILGLSFIQGIKDNYLTLAVGTIAGNLNITSEAEYMTCDSAAIGEIEKLTKVTAVAPRIMNSSFIVKDDNYSVCTCIGIDTAKEKELVSNFSSVDKPFILPADNSIAITNTVAEKLNVEVGDLIQLSVTTKENERVVEDFTVSCIYEGKATNSAIESWIIINIDTLQKMMKLNENEVSTLKIFTSGDLYNLDIVQNSVQAILETKNNGEGIVECWYNTEAADYMTAPTIYSSILLVFAGILFILIAIGITSVLFSAMLGRVREFGVLQAMGMSRRKIAAIYFIEIMMIVGASAVVAILVSVCAVAAVNKQEISTFSEALVFTFGGRVLRLSFTAANCIFPIIIVSVLSSLTSIISVIKVTKIKLIDALNF